MHIDDVIAKLNEMKQSGFTECRSLDEYEGTTEAIPIQQVMIDSAGHIVGDDRVKFAEYEPYEREAYKESYTQYFLETYPTFEDFYSWMEGNRIKEVELIKSARPVVLIGFETLPLN
jgi:predicted methyltransferase